MTVLELLGGLRSRRSMKLAVKNVTMYLERAKKSDDMNSFLGLVLRLRLMDDRRVYGLLIMTRKTNLIS